MVSKDADKTTFYNNGKSNVKLLTANTFLENNIIFNLEDISKVPNNSTYTSKKGDIVSNSIISGKSYIGDVADPKDHFEINLTIPAGYYPVDIPLTKTFTNIVPQIEANGATAEYIVAGYKAYDEDGNLIVGTMASNSISGATEISMIKGDGYANGTGNLITLIESEGQPESTIPYIKIDGSGSVSASYDIPDGYHSGDSVVGAVTSSNTATKYYTFNKATYTNEISNNELKFKVENAGYAVAEDIVASCVV